MKMMMMIMIVVTLRERDGIGFQFQLRGICIKRVLNGGVYVKSSLRRNLHRRSMKNLLLFESFCKL